MSTTTPAIIDDKSPICIPFILTHLENHLSKSQDDNTTVPAKPFFIGLNGVQGVGKTTLVRSLAAKLTSLGHETLVFSLDDLYLTNADQRALAASQSSNPLVQQRGEPGTHDMHLASAFFSDLKAGRPARVPRYDKAAFSGRGDRAPPSTWTTVNGPHQPRVQVVIFEGWSVGFRALASDQEVEDRWRDPGARTLGQHRLEHLTFVNERLRGYDVMTDELDVFVHIDAEDTMYVYDWRMQQERALREERGAGMTDDEVVRFVDGYYPAYELYADQLRRGVFKGREGAGGRQLRMVVGKDRKVKETEVL